MSGSGNGNGHHWSKFSWRDWSADKALHPCSLAAKGFWVELLCIMHEGTPVGHLTLGGKPATIRQMAANAYCSEKEATKYLAELEEAGVFSRTVEGTIYSRRMVKDAAASDAGREHIAKRWNGAKPTDPPNRGPNRVPNSKPNGVASSPPNSQAYREPTRDPITKNLETETELEDREEKESKILILTSKGEYVSPPACETAPPEAEPEAETLNTEAAAVANIVAQSLGKSLRRPAYAQGKPARFSRETQADLMSLKRPKTAHLSPEILAAMPHRLQAQPPQLQRAA